MVVEASSPAPSSPRRRSGVVILFLILIAVWLVVTNMVYQNRQVDNTDSSSSATHDGMGLKRRSGIGKSRLLSDESDLSSSSVDQKRMWKRKKHKNKSHHEDGDHHEKDEKKGTSAKHKQQHKNSKRKGSSSDDGASHHHQKKKAKHSSKPPQYHEEQQSSDDGIVEKQPMTTMEEKIDNNDEIKQQVSPPATIFAPPRPAEEEKHDSDSVLLSASQKTDMLEERKNFLGTVIAGDQVPRHLEEGDNSGTAEFKSMHELFSNHVLDIQKQEDFRRHSTKQKQRHAASNRAYLLIISNDDFVDGALVLGTSLRRNSKYLQRGEADMAVIVSRGKVSFRSYQRLVRDGKFDVIVEVPSLAPRAPGAYWKDTFDKIYMFNLTIYEKVIFMDADMLCVKSQMDVLFEKNFGDSSYLGAIGGHAKNPQETYFQTGMMVIQPNQNIFVKIMKEFESGIPPHGVKYNQGMNGRDGVLLRNVFGGNFKAIDNKYSRNLNPRNQIPKGVVALHFRGKHKPWFDMAKPNVDPELGKKEYGFPYAAWWEIYESIHRQSLEYLMAMELYMKDHPREEGGKENEKKTTSFELRNFVSEEQEELAKYTIEEKRQIVENYGKQQLSSLSFDSSSDDHGKKKNKKRKEQALAASATEEGRAAGERFLVPVSTGHPHLNMHLPYVTTNPGEEGHQGDHPVVRSASHNHVFNPLTHVWMLRFTKKSYVQLLSAEDKKIRAFELPENTKYIVSKFNQSCDEACGDESLFRQNKADETEKKKQRSNSDGEVEDEGGKKVERGKGGGSTNFFSCSPKMLYASPLQDCIFLEKYLQCTSCEMGVYWRHHPGRDFPSIETNKTLKLQKACRFNYLHDERSLPTCEAKHVSSKRLCPCVPALP